MLIPLLHRYLKTAMADRERDVALTSLDLSGNGINGEVRSGGIVEVLSRNYGEIVSVDIVAGTVLEGTV